MHLSVKMGRHGRYVFILEFDLMFDSGLNEVVLLVLLMGVD